MTLEEAQISDTHSLKDLFKDYIFWLWSLLFFVAKTTKHNETFFEDFISLCEVPDAHPLFRELLSRIN